MRFRLARPAYLVDINSIAELAYVREADGFLLVGACARDFALEESVREERVLASIFAVDVEPKWFSAREQRANLVGRNGASRESLHQSIRLRKRKTAVAKTAKPSAPSITS